MNGAGGQDKLNFVPIDCFQVLINIISYRRNIKSLYFMPPNSRVLLPKGWFG
jgi:hypothetical protein